MKKKKRSVRDGGEREKNWQEACTAVSGCSEEYRLWHPLVVLHTLCLIKHTSNTLADFLPRGVWGGERAHSFSCVCVCARACVCSCTPACLLRKALLMFCLSKMGQPSTKQARQSTVWLRRSTAVKCCFLVTPPPPKEQWIKLTNDPVCVCVCVCEYITYLPYYHSPATLFTSIKLFAH